MGTKIELTEREMITEINRNFLIRYNYYSVENITYLIGAGKYHTIVGRQKQIEHFREVLRSRTDKVTFKIRGSLKIDFLAK